MACVAGERSDVMTDSVTQLPTGLTVATDRVPGARSVAIGVVGRDRLA